MGTDMKKKLLSVAALAVLCAYGMAAADNAVLAFFMGRVEVQAAGADAWEAAVFGQELKAGAKIKTYEESRAEITIGPDNVIRIGEKSLYVLKEASLTDAGLKARGELSAGKMWSNIKKITQSRADFKVQTPTAVAAIRGTIYDIETAADSSSTIKVYDGEVEVSNPPEPPKTEQAPAFGGPREVGGPQRIAPPREVSMEQWVEVIKAQQQIFIGRDGSKKITEFDLDEDAKDDWVAWNKERDAAR